MSLPNFKTQIKNIRKEAIEIGFSPTTIRDYETIWRNYIKWKNEENFIYDSNEYSRFLLEWYKFDVNTYTSKSKSREQQYMRSKRILDDFDLYKIKMFKRMFPKAIYNDYPNEWNNILKNYLKYSRNILYNSEKTLEEKQRYLRNILSYFNQKGISNLSEFNREIIISFINEVITKGEISKRRNFYILRTFLNFLFIEDILKEDLSIFIPKVRKQYRKKLPTYLKKEEVEELLENIPRIRKNDIRNYTIILIAARLGLRISDILNIKLKDIDWKNCKLNVLQPKTMNLNILPLSKEVGWAIIDYIKKSRPITDNEYLFVKQKYPFDKMERFNGFNRYFDKIDIQIEENNKKGIHNLRHSLATNLLENETPVDIISSILGHKIQNTTSNIYLKIDIKNLKKCGLEVDE